MAGDFQAWHAAFMDAFRRMYPQADPSYVDVDSLKDAWRSAMSPVTCASQRAYRLKGASAPPAVSAAQTDAGWLSMVLRWAAIGVWAFGAMLAFTMAAAALFGSGRSVQMPTIPGVEVPSAGPTVFALLASAGYMGAFAAGMGGLFWYLSVRSRDLA